MSPALADTLTVNNIEKTGEIHVAVYDNTRAFFGPPAFTAAAFELNGATTQSIDL